MQSFSLPIQIRWADIDQNRHLRHSVYYDYGATVRIACFSQQGLTTAKLEELGIGPIAFREEAVFRRELKFEDQITINLEVVKATKDFGRWTIRHQIFKAVGTLAATLTLDGAWIDLHKRKLAIPDAFAQNIFNDFPKAKEFAWVLR